MPRSPNVSRCSYDQYDLDDESRHGSRSRSSSRRRHRDIEADAPIAQEEGLSSDQKVGICAIATGFLLLAGLGIAACCGVFTPKTQQPYHHQHQGVNHQIIMSDNTSHMSPMTVPDNSIQQQPVEQPVKDPVVHAPVDDMGPNSSFPDMIPDSKKSNGCRVTQVAPHRAPKKSGGTVWEPLVLPVSTEEAIASAQKWCEKVEGRAKMLEKTKKASYTHIHYQMKTFLFRFKDDFRIKFTPLKAGTRIEVQSQSRVGKSDLGKNPKRVAKFLTWMEKQHPTV